MASKKNNTVNNETKLVCPNCGAEFEINKHECQVKNATVIGADSGLGTIYMKLKDRQEQLNKAGIDTSSYFSMNIPGEGEKLMKKVGNVYQEVEDNDPVMLLIMKGGTIPNRDLFRRWVMAQVFQGLVYDGYWGHGFAGWVKARGYKYTWMMTEEEFRVQSKLYVKDMENFKQRNRWFNKSVAFSMCEDYLKKLGEVISNKKANHLHKCKGVPYICIGGRNVFCSDIYSKIQKPLYDAEVNVSHAKTPYELYTAFRHFRTIMIGLDWDTPHCADWFDAYKGAGAYYTMKNIILFHEGKFRGSNGRFITKQASLDYLEAKAEEYSHDGWKLFGVMKKLIKDAGIDIDKKRQEWAMAKKIKH
jgi:hypothetical protein